MLIQAPSLATTTMEVTNHHRHHQHRVEAEEEIINNNQMKTDNSDNLTQTNNTITTSPRSNIVDFYHDRSVLITGGSGFIGKVLIEKLLRSCKSIRHIFVLMRPKWNKQPRERMQELLNTPLFDGIRRYQAADLQEKVIVVEGDVTQTNLGLSEQNLLRIMNEVSVIYHSAATVKFDEPLKQSVAINIAGTKNMIEVCRKIPQLAALVHVSTAYANCDRNEIDEHIYPVNMSPEKIVELANWLDQDIMQEMKLRLLGARPNTYTYTKALAEWLLLQSASDLPVIICRPSIVAASWKEPFSGWIDNVNGPTGIILGTGKGLIRSMFADPKCVADLVPVDTVINLIITLGWFANVYQKHKQHNDTTESLTESLIGSSSGDESFDGFTDQMMSSLAAEEDHVNYCNDGNSISPHGRHQDSRRHDTNNVRSNSNDKNNNNHDDDDDDDNDGCNNNYNNNNNNNNNNHLHSSTANFHTSGGYKSQAAKGCKLIVDNGDRQKSSLYFDDGYASAIHSPEAKSTTSLSSSSTTTTTTKKQNNYCSTTSASETKAMTMRMATSTKDNNINHIESNHEKHDRVLSFVAQRRLEEQKQAAFEYKLKQFRHNTQVKLTAQDLPEEIADIPVFHCTSGSSNPITWLSIQVTILTMLSIYPSIATYRYPNGAFTNHKLLDDFYRITLHYIPGYIVDFVTKLLGGKPVLVKIFTKYDQAANVLKAFTSRQWKFNSHNHSMLINELMSEEDKRLFNFDLKPLNWQEYLRGYVLGVRKFMLKEPIENLQQARANLRTVYYRNLSLQVLFFAIVAYYTLIVNLFN